MGGNSNRDPLVDIILEEVHVHQSLVRWVSIGIHGRMISLLFGEIKHLLLGHVRPVSIELPGVR